jgi:DME family drug/metabolite transporter
LLPDLKRSAWALSSILYLGAVPTALAYTLFFAGLGVVRATTASVIALVEPLTAAVIGILVFGERLNAVMLTGTALMLFAVLFLAADERPRRTPSPSTPTPDPSHDQHTPHASTRAKG